MASLIKMLLLFIIILTLQTSLATSIKKPNPLAIVLPLIKDKATSLYYTNLNIGNNNHSLLTHNLALDLGGGSAVLLRCNTAVKSTTYHPIRCNSTRCKQAKPSLFCFNNTTTCGKYVSTSFTEHPLNTLLGLDTISLLTSKHNTIRSYLTLACTYDVDALKLMPEIVNGTIGLGMSSISLPSQIHKIQKKLVFCLPSKPAGLGRLQIGGDYVSRNLTSTPLIVDGSSGGYFIDVKSIKIAGKIVPLSEKIHGNTMICTLAPYTVLETSIYKALVREFVRETKMSRVEKVKPFEVCFSDKGIRDSSTAVPVIDLVFDGGAKWRINGWNSMVKVKKDVVCLGFLDGGSNMNTTEMVIGGFQMEDSLMEFDLEASKFSFSSSLLLRNTSCSQNIHF